MARTCAIRFALLAALLAAALPAQPSGKVPEAAGKAFDAGDYPRAIAAINAAIAAAPREAPLHHFLAQCYFESEQFDRAIPPAETAVALDPGNSLYHELLGRAYGEKADRSSWFSGLSLAKKARKEFEIAVRLDPRNYSAAQALIEYDCTAPGIAGGGEDKARAEIEKLAQLDAAEGHYARGNCRRQKKDFAAADAEFRKALALDPGSADLIYDIGDYYSKHDQPQPLGLVLAEGQRAVPDDPRTNFYRAVADILEKKDADRSDKRLREYLANTPRRSNYPSPAMTHYWLGRLQENRNDLAGAKREYREALNLEPKNRYASEALKRLQ
ncbi:MAG TPA: tetratricopeptide repeat protein [Dongiaceae bacterium]|nr:tetratricopeptide repeat protein [Dongiaceae bacterium]